MCRVQREKTWYSGRRGCILSRYQGQNGNPGLTALLAAGAATVIGLHLAAGLRERDADRPGSAAASSD